MMERVENMNRLESIEHDGIVPVKIFYFKKKDNALAQMVMPHWHRDIELDYLVKGNTVMIVRGVRHEVKTGEVILINSERIHSSVPSRLGKEEESIVLLIDFNYMKKYIDNLDSYCFRETFTQEQQEFLKQRMAAIARIYLEQPQFRELRITEYMLEIMLYLAENCVEKVESHAAAESSTLQNVSRAIEYIEKNYWQSISLQSISDYLGLDKSYFSRCFKKTTGECFKDYLQKKRLNMSLKELLDPESTVTGVAYKNGFPNLKSYINAFKKYYFLTPRQYILHQRKNSPEEGISPQKSKIDITIDKECL